MRTLIRLVSHQAVASVAALSVQSDVWSAPEPRPDFAVARPRQDFYAGAHPRPEEILLIVEVAHTTLSYDREIKLPLYALAGIPEVWIVDVDGG